MLTESTELVWVVVEEHGEDAGAHADDEHLRREILDRCPSRIWEFPPVIMLGWTEGEPGHGCDAYLRAVRRGQAEESLSNGAIVKPVAGSGCRYYFSSGVGSVMMKGSGRQS